jgi:hypothetical protein
MESRAEQGFKSAVSGIPALYLNIKILGFREFLEHFVQKGHAFCRKLSTFPRSDVNAGQFIVSTGLYSQDFGPWIMAVEDALSCVVMEHNELGVLAQVDIKLDARNSPVSGGTKCCHRIFGIFGGQTPVRKYEWLCKIRQQRKPH